MLEIWPGAGVIFFLSISWSIDGMMEGLFKRAVGGLFLVGIVRLFSFEVSCTLPLDFVCDMCVCCVYVCWCMFACMHIHIYICRLFLKTVL